MRSGSSNLNSTNVLKLLITAELSNQSDLKLDLLIPMQIVRR